MKLTRPKTTAKICAASALIAVLAAAGMGTAAAQQADAAFGDVGEDHIFGEEISVLVDTGVLDSSDASGGSFNSADPVTPADMTRWMGNIADKYDVDTGIIGATTEALQHSDSLSRNGAAAVFSAFFDLPTPGSAHSFSDVSPTFDNSVSSLKAGGITNGCGSGDAYCGTRKFTRGQAAAFMGRFVAKYGASRSTSIADDTGIWGNDWYKSYGARAYAGSSTSTSAPSVSCGGGTHSHFSGGGGAPPGGCHSHSVSVPTCSATAGNNRSYNIHVGGGHNSGYVPSCPPPQISLSSPNLQLEVTAGQTPVIVLQADDGAQTTREYSVTLAPHEQGEAMQTWCATPAGADSASTMCTTPARPGDDYADRQWDDVEIVPGLPPVELEITDPNTGMAVPPRLDFGDQPREFEIIITDNENPDVSVSVVLTINPPAIPSS